MHTSDPTPDTSLKPVPVCLGFRISIRHVAGNPAAR